MLSQKLHSSFIEGVCHANGSLVIEFKNGKRYRYRDVPSNIYIAICKSMNAGVYYTENIKGKYQSLLLQKNQM